MEHMKERRKKKKKREGVEGVTAADPVGKAAKGAAEIRGVGGPDAGAPKTKTHSPTRRPAARCALRAARSVGPEAEILATVRPPPPAPSGPRPRPEELGWGWGPAWQAWPGGGGGAGAAGGGGRRRRRTSQEARSKKQEGGAKPGAPRTTHHPPPPRPDTPTPGTRDARCAPVGLLLAIRWHCYWLTALISKLLYT
jgi:hypothetical protein